MFQNIFQALIDMVDRSNIKKTIIITDRGYKSYNVFEHIVRKNWNYVIRVKDIYSNGIASGLSISDKEIFDIEHSPIEKIKEIHRMLWGIERDYEEVVNAVYLPYSNGLAEGYVNRIKFIKRVTK